MSLKINFQQDVGNKIFFTGEIDNIIDNLSSPLYQAIIDQIKTAIVDYFVQEGIKKLSPEIWSMIDTATIARMAEISCGRKAIRDAINETSTKA